MKKNTKLELFIWTIAAGITFLVLPSAPSVVDPVSTKDAAIYVGLIWAVISLLVIKNGGESDKNIQQRGNRSKTGSYSGINNQGGCREND